MYTEEILTQCKCFLNASNSHNTGIHDSIEYISDCLQEEKDLRSREEEKMSITVQAYSKQRYDCLNNPFSMQAIVLSQKREDPKLGKQDIESILSLSYS